MLGEDPRDQSGSAPTVIEVGNGEDAAQLIRGERLKIEVKV